MKVGLVGPTYQQASLPFDAQRSINIRPEMDQMGKEVAAMVGTPGLSLFSNIGSFPIRGEFSSEEGRAFAVSGSILYEIDSSGNGTSRGVLLGSSGIVSFDENNNQLAICDGQYLYIFAYATNVFQRIVGGLEYVTNGSFSADTNWTKGSGWTISGGVANASSASTAISQTSTLTLVAGDPYTITYTITASAGSLIPSIGGTSGITRSAAGTYTETIICGATQVIAFTGSAFSGTLDNASINDKAFGLPSSIGSLTFLDSFFLVSQNNTGHFFKSAPNDGTKWDSLDFATAESSPDNLVRVISAIGQLWLQGTDTTEIWTNTGGALFPFKKISGGKMMMGINAANTAIELDNTLFWLGRNQQGFGIVCRAVGFIPKRISTTPIEIMLRKATDSTNIRAWAYQEDGHLYYILTGGGLETSLVYDVTTDMWHERAFLNNGVFEQHLGCCYMRSFDKHLIGDRNTGKIYSLEEDVYDDNGFALRAERTYTHLSDEDKRQRYNRLVIGAESGVGTQIGQGINPQMELYISKDGARTWAGPFTEPIGKVGEYFNKCEFRRLGVAQQMTFKIAITDPVKRYITGSYLS